MAPPRLLRRLGVGLLWAAAVILAVSVVALATSLWLAERRETRTAAEIAPPGGRYVKADDVEVSVGAWLPLLTAHAPARSEDPAGYRRLAMPLTAIWGARDTVTPLDQGQRLVGLVPAAKLEILPNAGHIPQIETPREFDQRLVETLRALDRAAEP